MFEQFKDWWEGASEREQKMVLASAVVVLIALVYFLLWQPLASEMETKQQALERAEQTLSWVENSSSKLIIAGVGGNKKSSRKSDLSQLINRTAKRYQVNISRIQSRDGRVDVWINRVEFKQFVDWLTKLENQYQVHIENVDINRGKEKGLIKVSRLSLSN